MSQTRIQSALGALVILMAAGPVHAQQHGTHDHQADMGNHMEMGEMQGLGMTDHMNTVMDHMSEMMHEMHGLHGEMTDHPGMKGMVENQGVRMEMMREMSEDMKPMMQAMQSMLKDMQRYTGDEAMMADEAIQGHMGNMMDSLSEMMESGKSLMSTVVEVGKVPEPEHDHQHRN